MGPANIHIRQVLMLFSDSTSIDQTTWMILFKIRLPRILLAGVVGFSLSIGGVVFQALLRNPLAEPFILGVSSGSAVGAIAGIFFGLSIDLGVPFLSFMGALFTIFLVMGIGRRQGGLESSTLLLTGVIVNAFFTAIIMFLFPLPATPGCIPYFSGYMVIYHKADIASFQSVFLLLLLYPL